MIIDNTPTDTLDPASSLPNLGSKMGIDATTKSRDEGYTREAQQLALVDEKTRALVDHKWPEYGLG
jgi:4-hydroxy-3-polyprenylbenzoate decarboxylase